ncbi:MAG: hypothetical protein DM484_00865 [Candidatus Methylumidiphilus alinenensis]|uniref:Uncharacterized protein n=1 Tax=Candidatus Methylumidiphilus alinenensis TaxID=2202197 RepID=A0A2W4RR83_9GAMM|nr:MAG: hypothetical protein DM484_00865 [Candidatus Methylumidiphilus alinenensis]
MGWQVAWIKHLHNLLITFHGLDFGIHAEMTAFPVYPDLCITTSSAHQSRTMRLFCGYGSNVF